jgi:hypothetical protein
MYTKVNNITLTPLKHTPQCKGCGTTRNPGQWWHLSNYFKISGMFCSACYDKVSHDSYGEPNHPHDYLLMLLKLS